MRRLVRSLVHIRTESPYLRPRHPVSCSTKPSKWKRTPLTLVTKNGPDRSRARSSHPTLIGGRKAGKGVAEDLIDTPARPIGRAPSSVRGSHVLGEATARVCPVPD